MASLTVAQVRARLESCADLSPVASCEVTDLSGSCGTSFSVRVSARVFAGQSRLKHKRVFEGSIT